VLAATPDLAAANGPLFPDSTGGWRDTLLDEGALSARQIADQLGHAKCR
jgi:hypothetical protein